ncbi:sugar kinase [Amycolatopsis acidicola]|uniref:Sugar kinase n=1 Tax=Amycolatopsis acidicola TaxID=2596893 RepID=A0A5N0VI60_9PSEU|nr:PfkB family carbohydrate kinase [Amycolatopsis acidicola]KAA9165855.1 sugar kinase [Amycolatopsis acidicola]
MSRLVHVGQVVVDVLLRLPELPGPGCDVLATESRIAVGGGLTVLSTAVRQGLPAAYAGMHGTGPMADLAREALAQAGAELLQPRLPKQDTGFTVVMVESDGERTFATSVGAEGELGSAELARLRLRPDDVVYISGFCLVQPRNGPAIAEWLSTVDVPVIVDPGPLVAEIPEDVLAPVLARADWWTCNEYEGILLTGEAEPAPALAGRTGGVVVRMGADGCVLAKDGEVRWIPGYPVKSTGRSGDVHVGAFAAALAAGEPPERAVARANAVAALTLTHRGAAPAAAEVDAFLAARR